MAFWDDVNSSALGTQPRAARVGQAQQSPAEAQLGQFFWPDAAHAQSVVEQEEPLSMRLLKANMPLASGVNRFLGHTAAGVGYLTQKVDNVFGDGSNTFADASFDLARQRQAEADRLNEIATNGGEMTMYQQVAEGIGQQVPRMGIGALTGLASGAGSVAGTFLNPATIAWNTLSDATGEAGTVYNELIDGGASPEEAQRQADYTVAYNLMANVPIEILGGQLSRIAARMPGVAGIIGAAMGQGAEEAFQEPAQDVASQAAAELNADGSLVSPGQYLERLGSDWGGNFLEAAKATSIPSFLTSTLTGGAMMAGPAIQQGMQQRAAVREQQILEQEAYEDAYLEELQWQEQFDEPMSAGQWLGPQSAIEEATAEVAPPAAPPAVQQEISPDVPQIQNITMDPFVPEITQKAQQEEQVDPGRRQQALDWAASEMDRITSTEPEYGPSGELMNPMTQEDIARYDTLTRAYNEGDYAAIEAIQSLQPVVQNPMIVGPNAQLNNEERARYEIAAQMQQQGQDSDAIRAATDWFLGAEGMLRTEVPDMEQDITPANELQEGVVPLGDIYRNETVNRMYPDLAEIPVTVDDTQNPFEAAFQEQQQTMDLGTATGREGVVHEVQHAIQGREGYARGSSPEHEASMQSRAQTPADLDTAETRDIREQIARLKSLPQTPHVKQQLKELRSQLQNLFTDYKATDPEDLYYASPGEDEAIDTENRIGMDEEQIRANPRNPAPHGVIRGDGQYSSPVTAQVRAAEQRLAEINQELDAGAPWSQYRDEVEALEQIIRDNRNGVAQRSAIEEASYDDGEIDNRLSFNQSAQEALEEQSTKARAEAAARYKVKQRESQIRINNTDSPKGVNMLSQAQKMLEMGYSNDEILADTGYTRTKTGDLRLAASERTRENAIRRVEAQEAEFNEFAHLGDDPNTEYDVNEPDIAYEENGQPGEIDYGAVFTPGKGITLSFNQNGYNGSPIDFDTPFSTKYIGSGQGAAVHGWGLYFSSSANVSERYRRAYSTPTGVRFINGIAPTEAEQQLLNGAIDWSRIASGVTHVGLRQGLTDREFVQKLLRTKYDNRFDGFIRGATSVNNLRLDGKELTDVQKMALETMRKRATPKEPVGLVGFMQYLDFLERQRSLDKQQLQEITDLLKGWQRQKLAFASNGLTKDQQKTLDKLLDPKTKFKFENDGNLYLVKIPENNELLFEYGTNKEQSPEMLDKLRSILDLRPATQEEDSNDFVLNIPGGSIPLTADSLEILRASSDPVRQVIGEALYDYNVGYIDAGLTSLPLQTKDVREALEYALGEAAGTKTIAALKDAIQLWDDGDITTSSAQSTNSRNSRVKGFSYNGEVITAGPKTTKEPITVKEAIQAFLSHNDSQFWNVSDLRDFAETEANITEGIPESVAYNKAMSDLFDAIHAGEVTFSNGSQAGWRLNGKEWSIPKRPTNEAPARNTEDAIAQTFWFMEDLNSDSPDTYLLNSKEDLINALETEIESIQDDLQEDEADRQYAPGALGVYQKALADVNTPGFFEYQAAEYEITEDQHIQNFVASDEVKKAVTKFLKPGSSMDIQDLLRGQLEMAAKRYLANNPITDAVTGKPYNYQKLGIQPFWKAGIPGLRYKGEQQWSGKKEGVDNFVIWDEDAATRVKKFFQKMFTGSGQKGIKALSTKFIGTGEGRADEGWGLYLSAEEAEARGYKDLYREQTMTIGGQELSMAESQILLRSLYRAKVDPASLTTKVAREAIAQDLEVVTNLSQKRALQKMARMTGEIAQKNTGAVYDVEGPEDTSLLIHKSKFDQQPVAVQAKLEDFAKLHKGNWVGQGIQEFIDGNGTVQDLQKKLSERFRQNIGLSEKSKAWQNHVSEADKAVSMVFKDAGIPGLTYMSNGDVRQEATKNYVIWDDDTLSVVSEHDQASTPGNIDGVDNSDLDNIADESEVYKDALGKFEKAGIAGAEAQGQAKIYSLATANFARMMGTNANDLWKSLNFKVKVQNMEGLRGQIQMVLSADKTRIKETTIILDPRNRSVSTTFHEQGHFFTELMKQAAMSNPNNKQAVDGWNAIKRFVGAKDDDLTSEQHELMGNGYMNYILLGTAPNAELKSLYERFKAWMTNFWSTLAPEARVMFNQEVRDVFNGLLSSDSAYDSMYSTDNKRVDNLSSPQDAKAAKTKSVTKGNVTTVSKVVDNSDATNSIIDNIASPNVVALRHKKFSPVESMGESALREQRALRAKYNKAIDRVFGKPGLWGRKGGIAQTQEDRDGIFHALFTGDLYGMELNDELLTKYGLTDNAKEGYKRVRRIYQSMGEAVNAQRRKYGKEEVDLREGYVSHVFHSFRVHDDQGIVSSFRTLKEATKFAESIATDSRKITIRPAMQDFDGQARRDAVVMGDMQYFKFVNNVANVFALSVEDAKKFANDSAHMAGKSRFFGNTKFREGYAGYDTDMEYAVRRYANNASRYIAMDTFKHDSRRYFERVFGRFDREYKGIAKYTKDYINDVSGVPTAWEDSENRLMEMSGLSKFVPADYQDRAAIYVGTRIRGTTAVMKLGFLNMASALINLSSLNGTGAMVGYGRTTAAIKEYLSPNLTTKKLYVELGLENDATMMDSSGRTDYGARRKFEAVGGALFSVMDGSARKISAIAAYRKAIKDGKNQTQAYAYARDVVNKTNFNYGVDDAPNAFRRYGQTGQTLLQFKKYPIKVMELGLTHLEGMDKAKFWAGNLVLAGVIGGIPGFAAIRAAVKALFPDKDIELEIKRVVADLPLPNSIKRTLIYGALSNIGINISSRVGVSDILPDQVSEAFGPGIGTIADIIEQSPKLMDGPGGALDVVSALIPGIGNPAKAYAGSTFDSKGKLKYIFSDMERISKAIGFTPIGETVESDAVRLEAYEKSGLTKEQTEAIANYLADRSSENRRELTRLKVTPARLKRAMADSKKKSTKTAYGRAMDTAKQQKNRAGQNILTNYSELR